MKGFALTATGDLLIENGEIQMAHGADLTMQTIKSTLGTKKGEWFLDWEQGIDYDSIFGKKRHASQNNAISSQYVRQINTMNDQNNALSEKLARRLDGVD